MLGMVSYCLIYEFFKDKSWENNMSNDDYLNNAVTLYKHFYDRRTSFLAAYVAALATLGALTIQYPDNMVFSVMLLFFSALALYLDFYIHKRVMISAAVVVKLESDYEKYFSNDNKDSKNIKEISKPQEIPRKKIIGVMNQIIAARGRHYFKQTKGRYFVTYGIGTILVSIIILSTLLMNLHDELDTLDSLESGPEKENQSLIVRQCFIKCLFFPILFCVYLFFLYSVVLDASTYEEIFDDLVSYNTNREKYNDLRPFLKYRNRFYYYKDKVLRKCIRDVFDEPEFIKIRKRIVTNTKSMDRKPLTLKSYNESRIQKKKIKKKINSKISAKMHLTKWEKVIFSFYFFIIVSLLFLMISFALIIRYELWPL